MEEKQGLHMRLAYKVLVCWPDKVINIFTDKPESGHQHNDKGVCRLCGHTKRFRTWHRYRRA